MVLCCFSPTLLHHKSSAGKGDHHDQGVIIARVVEVLSQIVGLCGVVSMTVSNMYQLLQEADLCFAFTIGKHTVEMGRVSFFSWPISRLKATINIIIVLQAASLSGIDVGVR